MGILQRLLTSGSNRQHNFNHWLVFIILVTHFSALLAHMIYELSTPAYNWRFDVAGRFLVIVSSNLKRKIAARKLGYNLRATMWARGRGCNSSRLRTNRHPERQHRRRCRWYMAVRSDERPSSLIFFTPSRDIWTPF